MSTYLTNVSVDHWVHPEQEHIGLGNLSVSIKGCKKKGPTRALFHTHVQVLVSSILCEKYKSHFFNAR